MDAITLLKQDHQKVEKLFKRFEDAGDRAFVEKRRIVDRIIEELSVHAAIEEQLFYPVTRATVDDVEDVALESLEEHHVMKVLLAELQHLDPHHERFDAKVTVLMENVRHHVDEEESEYFPKVRDELGRKGLGELGDAMAEARATAPTRPHPLAPDEAPAGIAAGNLAGVVDRARDTAHGVAQGGVAAVLDVADRIRGAEPRRAAPTGSRRSRQVATAVRDDSADLLDRTIDAVRQARDAGRDAITRTRATTRATTESAATGARRTAGSARRGVRTTKTTAKQASTSTARTARRTSARPSETTAS